MTTDDWLDVLTVIAVSLCILVLAAWWRNRGPEGRPMSRKCTYEEAGLPPLAECLLIATALIREEIRVMAERDDTDAGAMLTLLRAAGDEGAPGRVVGALVGLEKISAMLMITWAARLGQPPGKILDLMVREIVAGAVNGEGPP